MGTRGAFGVRIDGQDKITYNHFDSYPAGLGANVVRDIIQMKVDKFDLPAAAKRLLLIDDSKEATPEQIEKLKQFANPAVSTQSLEEWYVLLRNLQGELYDILKAGVMIDSAAFLLDSLFCKHAYVLNLDSGMFEYYEGFQEKPHDRGRYAAGDLKEIAERTARPGTGNVYYGVALKQELPLDYIQGLKLKQVPRFLEDLEDDEPLRPAVRRAVHQAKRKTKVCA